MLDELDVLCKNNDDSVEIIYLYNFHEHIELPDPSIYATKGAGINISASKLTNEVIRNCHANGKKVGVWVDAATFKEDATFYRRMMNMGVDFFCTDYPLAAMETRSQWLEERTVHSFSTQSSAVSATSQ